MSNFLKKVSTMESGAAFQVAKYEIQTEWRYTSGEEFLPKPASEKIKDKKGKHQRQFLLSRSLSVGLNEPFKHQ